jgi:glycosyltransferase involved in cell wall biosynthesis
MRQIPNILKSLVAGEPLYVKYVKSAAMKTAITDMINTRHIDLIHFDDQYITANFEFDNKSNIKKTVTYHDIDSTKYLRIYKIETNIRKKMMLLLDLFLLKKWEQALVKKADLSIVMSHIDAKTLKSRAIGANITVIPNGVDTEIFLFDHGDNMSNTISFFGNMDYFPNQDAVFYFYQQILPIIRHKKPEVKFIVVGRNPSRKLQDLANDPNIIVTGNVDNVIPYYYKSSVAVVPLRAGGGTRLKILEAMALGRPVVSTSIGCEGLEVVDGEHLLIADHPEQFAEKTVRLLTDRQLYQHISTNGRQLVETRYDWDKIAGRLMEVYAEMLA